MSKWPVRTFTTDTGRKPVEEWIAGIEDAATKAAIAAAIDLLSDQGAALGMPHARPLPDGLWELRINSKDTIERVLYFHWFGRTFGLLHGFTKKTQKTPTAEIEIARERRAIWLSRPKAK